LDAHGVRPFAILTHRQTAAAAIISRPQRKREIGSELTPNRPQIAVY
jgi:hypothetical protein